MCGQILSRPGPAPTEWSRLLEPLPFFEGFKHFLQVGLGGWVGGWLVPALVGATAAAAGALLQFRQPLPAAVWWVGDFCRRRAAMLVLGQPSQALALGLPSQALALGLPVQAVWAAMAHGWSAGQAGHAVHPAHCHYLPAAHRPIRLLPPNPHTNPHPPTHPTCHHRWRWWPAARRTLRCGRAGYTHACACSSR